jgi:hypothetical protein
MKNAMNSLVSIVNGLECTLMRQTFLDLQKDETSTNEQLVDDATKWNTYLDAYCVVQRKLNNNNMIH